MRGRTAGHCPNEGIMAFNAKLIKAAALGAAVAWIGSTLVFETDRKDARTWRKYVEYRSKCIEEKPDGSAIDRCDERRLAFADRFDKWRERCVRPGRPVPADCDRQLQTLD